MTKLNKKLAILFASATLLVACDNNLTPSPEGENAPEIIERGAGIHISPRDSEQAEKMRHQIRTLNK